MRRKLAAGNWKMNGDRAALAEIEQVAKAPSAAGVEVLICPPATLLAEAAARAAGTTVTIGGQDCHPAATGAHTGDISAPMLADAGAHAVILGHSERRADHGETSKLVHHKAQAAQAAGLVAIICVGETEAQRDDGTALEVVARQLAESLPDSAGAENTVIAYEPVWAIGTGRVPDTAQIAEMHSHLRASLAARLGTNVAQGIRILYGGSVKPGNATEIFATPNVDGALVGGASLKAGDFIPIINALAAAG